MKVLIGEKSGMIQAFDAIGNAVGATVVKVWPATVLRLRTKEQDGYEAMQLGAGTRREKLVGKAVMGQTGGKAYRFVGEFAKSEGAAVGQTLGLEQIKVGDLVSVTSVSKGKGFAGTIKRYNFSRGPKTHGSRNYRKPGSIGGTGAMRVFPGQKMPGRMGNETVTVRNILVTGVHPEEGVVLLQGGVPGPPGRVVKLTVTGHRAPVQVEQAEPSKKEKAAEEKAEAEAKVESGGDKDGGKPEKPDKPAKDDKPKEKAEVK